MKLHRDEEAWLRLALVPGVGTANFIRLLARFRTAEAVLKAGRGRLAEVVSKKLAQQIVQYADAADVEGQVRAMDRCGAHMITLEDSKYPTRLAEIYDPPLLLFVRVELREDDERCLAIVGTRRPTPYGVRMANQLGRELATLGITVVSGMASGVDTAAHRGAMEAGGRTIAVLGCGVDVVYPRENEELMGEIEKQGCVISQFPMGMKPVKGNFPYRNRIISGLTLGTVIVEAPVRSGALITARYAAEQGREVFAVPGQVGVHNSQGPHLLIREGAKLVESVEDVLAEVPTMGSAPVRPAVSPAVGEVEPEPGKKIAPTKEPPRAAPVTPPKSTSVSPSESAVLKALPPDGSFIDEIAARCRLSIAEALSALTMLELKGLVRQFSGKRFAPR
jgi:DNA processing protein